MPIASIWRCLTTGSISSCATLTSSTFRRDIPSIQMDILNQALIRMGNKPWKSNWKICWLLLVGNCYTNRQTHWTWPLLIAIYFLQGNVLMNQHFNMHEEVKNWLEEWFNLEEQKLKNPWKFGAKYVATERCHSDRGFKTRRLLKCS